MVLVPILNNLYYHQEVPMHEDTLQHREFCKTMLSTIEAGKMLGLHRNTIIQMCSRGLFKGTTRVGFRRVYRIPRIAIEAYIRENLVKPIELVSPHLARSFR